jgi:subtilase family serine protease
MTPKTFVGISLGLGFVLSAAAQSERSNLAGPPAGLEARPPIHIKGFLRTSPTGLTPAQVRHAYGFDQITGTGAGQTIAIVDAFGSATIQNDLDVFCDTFGLPRTTVQVIYAQAKSGRKDSGWALESSLDVQWAHVIAPGARIMLVVAKSASLSDLLGAVDVAVQNGAKVVSMSWGGSEFSSEASYDSHFNKAGVTFFASSGDNGAGVSWPAVSPYVVGVGGTTVTLDGANNIVSETAWSGSGGGVSAYETKPSFQNGWQAAAKRGVPDVSYNADPSSGVPVYISNYNGSTGWAQVGGTSAGAPQWAGLTAVANGNRVITGSSLSNANGALYSSAAANYAADFLDIVSGNNGGFNAGTAYDYVTGLGSPISNNLVPALTAK